MPKCPKCGHDKFIVSEIDLDHDKYDRVAICCESCDSVIGITEPYNIGETISSLSSGLESFVQKMNAFLGLIAPGSKGSSQT